MKKLNLLIQRSKFGKELFTPAILGLTVMVVIVVVTAAVVVVMTTIIVIVVMITDAVVIMMIGVAVAVTYQPFQFLLQVPSLCKIFLKFLIFIMATAFQLNAQVIDFENSNLFL